MGYSDQKQDFVLFSLTLIKKALFDKSKSNWLQSRQLQFLFNAGVLTWRQFQDEKETIAMVGISQKGGRKRHLVGKVSEPSSFVQVKLDSDQTSVETRGLHSTEVAFLAIPKIYI